MAGVTRRPFAGQITTVVSVDSKSAAPEEQVTFDIKRCGVKENIARQNLSQTVRYVTETAGEDVRYVTERNFPVGDLKLETIALGLAGWNISDDNNASVPVNRETIQSMLSPSEFEDLYDRVLDVNPMWKPGGEEETKKD